MFRILNQSKNSKYSRKPSVFLRSLPNKLIKFLSKTKKNSGILGGPGPDRQEQETQRRKNVQILQIYLCYFSLLVLFWLCFYWLYTCTLTKNTSLWAQCYYHCSNNTVLLCIIVLTAQCFQQFGFNSGEFMVKFSSVLFFNAFSIFARDCTKKWH